MSDLGHRPEPQGTRPFRLDVPLHELLMKPASPAPVPMLLPPSEKEYLPEPVFPQRTEPARQSSFQYTRWKAWRHWKALGTPYFKSRLLPGDFHPIIAYLFTEWKCNLDCHYCWAFDNSVKGMTEDVAKRSIDWLHSSGLRLLALMGGEPLLRPNFIHKVIYYAAKNDMLVYVPTNGRLLRPDVIDKLGDAGMGTVNLAVDCIEEKPGLEKALAPIRPYFEYLLKRMHYYGYTVFLNVCITRVNMDDVKELAGIARANNLGIDFHIVETPMVEQPHYKHLNDNSTFLRQEDHPQVEALIDWVIEQKKNGLKVVNQTRRLQQMKEFIHGGLEPWGCRAGQNTLIVRVDGTLAPCFPLYSAKYDWGTVGDHKFDTRQLTEMKKSCEAHCFSTLNHIMSYCYNNTRVFRWLAKQALHGFREATGAIE